MGSGWFRSMTPDADRLPVVGRHSRALGVRVPGDVTPQPDGRVAPGGGGMSVSPSTLWNLPHHRRPRPLGRGSTGPSGDVVYVLPALSSPALVVRLDPGRPDKHALIEPAELMPLGDYEIALVATRSRWERAWP